MPAAVSSLRISQHQQLALTPSLKLSIRLLELSTQDLQTEVQSQIDGNPLLAADSAYDPVMHEVSADTHSAEESDHAALYDDRIAWGELSGETTDSDFRFDALSSPQTLERYLLSQLQGVDESLRDCLIWLIGNLSEQGLLEDPFDELIALAPFSKPFRLWQKALETLQGLDPAGIGAENTLQCLLLQLDRLHTEQRAPEKTIELARTLLLHHQSDLARKDWSRLRSLTGSSVDAIKAAHALTQRLSLNPVNTISSLGQVTYIIPEILCEKTARGWQARINPCIIPRLHFNHDDYSMLLRSKLDTPSIKVWKKKARDAQQFLHALEMRFSTVTAVAQTLVEAQSEFLDQGRHALKPLRLKDIALKLNMAQSTVSRAINGKFLQTPHSSIALKTLLCRPQPLTNGESISTSAVREIIIGLISKENPLSPLSDQTISDQLNKKGIRIARRTVAKYREEEKIPPQSIRRQQAQNNRHV